MKKQTCTQKAMYSEPIKEFLNFLRNCQMEYDCAVQTESHTVQETQDILHHLELDDIEYHSLARYARVLRNVRCERRLSKDTEIKTTPILNWTRENRAVIKGLEQLLSEVRKLERTMDNRMYFDRTPVMEQVHGRKEVTPEPATLDLNAA